MNTKYKIALAIYAFLQLCFVLFVFMWSFGMTENPQFELAHFILLLIFFSNNMLLFSYPYIAKKRILFSKIVCCLNFSFFVFSLFLIKELVSWTDFSIVMVSFMLLFIGSGILLTADFWKLFKFKTFS